MTETVTEAEADAETIVDVCPCAIPDDDPLWSGHPRTAHDHANTGGCDGMPKDPCGTCANCSHIAHLELQRGDQHNEHGRCHSRCPDAQRWQSAWAHGKVQADRQLAKRSHEMDALLVLTRELEDLPADLAGYADQLASVTALIDAQRESNRQAYLAFVGAMHQLEEAIDRGVIDEAEAFRYMRKAESIAAKRFGAASPPAPPTRVVLGELARRVKAAQA